MSNTITRKIQIVPVGDKEEINRVYEYIRNGMKSQNLAMNQYMSALYISHIQDISKDDRKELNNLYGRIPTSSKGSAYSVEEIQFPKGLPTTASLSQKVRQDFQNQLKHGLQYGNISLINYKKDNPLLVHVDYVRLMSTNPHRPNGLYHNYENHNDFLDALKSGNPDVFIKFANGIIFKIVFGNPYKSRELRSVIQNIFEETYRVQGSSIQFNETGRKIILNLSMEIPVKEHELNEDNIVGVDLGLAIPAVCALNNSEYSREFIGDAQDFLNQRLKIQKQRQRLQRNLQYTSGGHGRCKKLKALDRIRNREKNFAQTYNHMVSKRVVDFAIKNNAKYINIEDLSGFGNKVKNTKHEEETKELKDRKFILANWSYYQLQQDIEYKAAMNGIEVRKIKPKYTSQTCSCCGYQDKDNRITQERFKCKKCGIELNADFNAARNISKSKEFVV